MNIGLHPHVIGQPLYSLAKRISKYLKQFKDIWFLKEELKIGT